MTSFLIFIRKINILQHRFGNENFYKPELELKVFRNDDLKFK